MMGMVWQNSKQDVSLESLNNQPPQASSFGFLSYKESEFFCQNLSFSLSSIIQYIHTPSGRGESSTKCTRDSIGLSLGMRAIMSRRLRLQIVRHVSRDGANTSRSGRLPAAGCRWSMSWHVSPSSSCRSIITKQDKKLSDITQTTALDRNTIIRSR